MGQIFRVMVVVLLLPVAYLALVLALWPAKRVPVPSESLGRRRRKGGPGGKYNDPGLRSRPQTMGQERQELRSLR